MQDPTLELGRRRIVGADAAGEALRGQVKSAKDEVQTASRPIERIVGRFGGFDLGVRATRSGEVPNLYLSGHCLYQADPYQTGPSLVATLLGALESIAKHRTDAGTLLATRRKRLEDLGLELTRPFEHEGRLADLLVRQRELLGQLDLDKDEAGIGKIDTEELRQAA